MTEPVAITILPDGQTISAATGTSLLEALSDRIRLRADCGGQGICGQCRVAIKDGGTLPPLTAGEKSALPAHLVDAGYRLACQLPVQEALSVWIPPTGRNSDSANGKQIFSGPYPVDGGGGNGGLGLAVDLGTTTVAAYLCDLQSGRILSSAVCGNPQRRYGEDVISRIQVACRSAEDLGRLRMLARQAVDYLADVCLAAVGSRKADIRKVMVAGNTAMQQIFAGIDPSGLTAAPFEPATREAVSFPAKTLDLDFRTGTPIYLMPVISGFAGGDTVACILADRPHHKEQIRLIVDVGTNGELVLAHGGRLWSTSCATGPAFEGARISSGMCAAAGAIAACGIDPETFRFSYRTIGRNGVEHPPLGFCGSGIVDAVAALRRTGIVAPSGRLQSTMPLVAPHENAAGGKVVLVPVDRNPAGVEISLTQRDIRQVQLAKAALAAGIRCLMETAGIRKLDVTILTGAFGSTFDWHSAVAIGLLPPVDVLGKVILHPNLAGEGAVRALLNRAQQSEARRICRNTRYLNLSDQPDFDRRFVAQLAFPSLD
ncbi:MAG TPA: ASKHA domain-containing protein [Desulfobacterales bacterium]